MSKKLTLEDFLSKSKSIHGTKYDYSNTVIETATDKVDITCPEHGAFQQQANVHYGGSGCPKCAKNIKIPVDELKVILSAVHGGKYQYPFTSYKNNKDKISIECSEHGVFDQAISDHKAGKGCFKCAKKATGKKKRTHADQFFKKCFDKHGDKYNYSLAKYRTNRDELIIICPEHGVFKQKAANHLKSGCLKCGKQLSGWRRSDFIKLSTTYHDGSSNLYIVRLSKDSEVFYKVGISNHTTSHRFRGSNTPYNIEEVKLIRSNAGFIWDMEKQVHKLLRKFKYKPKIEFDGHTECFSEIPKEVYRLLDRFNKTNQLQLIA